LQLVQSTLRLWILASISWLGSIFGLAIEVVTDGYVDVVELAHVRSILDVLMFHAPRFVVGSPVFAGLAVVWFYAHAFHHPRGVCFFVTGFRQVAFVHAWTAPRRPEVHSSSFEWAG
jgi:hypothetical protein